MAKVTKKRKEKKTVYDGCVYIQATFNNTIVTVTDLNGNAVSWASAGNLGFKEAMDYGLRAVNVFVKGPGVGRESAIRVLANLGLTVMSMKDITPIPHNGCRPKKTRRV